MNGRHGSVISRNNYLTNEGDPELYERYLGPRWYSFDIPGCHVVTMDWHTHELGLDHDIQNAWVKADLAAIEPGSPWILLFHDQPGSSILDEVPWQPVAAFSGHWHTSRVVQVGETLHVNSPTTFFASLDYTPPRIPARDLGRREHHHAHRDGPDSPGSGGARRRQPSTFAHRDAGGPSSQAVLWRRRLGGAGHRQRVTVSGDLVIAGTQIEDQPRGYVEALDLATGDAVWRTQVASAVKTTPAVWGDVVIAAEVSGDVHGLDRETGDVRWRSRRAIRCADSPGTHRPRSTGSSISATRPTSAPSTSSTGEVLWRRTDLSPHHNLVNHAAPLIVGDLLVMGFWPTPQPPRRARPPHRRVGVERPPSWRRPVQEPQDAC